MSRNEGLYMQDLSNKEPVQRCRWCTGDPLYIAYHDHEWGVPVYDDRHLFEMLILEGVQAGLSWITVLKKRQAYREAFYNFDIAKVAAMTDQDVALLLTNKGIIRNRLKINAAITNAKAVLRLQAEGISLSHFLWSYVNHQPQIPLSRSFEAIPTQTVESNAMSRALKKRGFKFVGPTICYALMQAVGMVNDHERECFLTATKPCQ